MVLSSYPDVYFAQSQFPNFLVPISPYHINNIRITIKAISLVVITMIIPVLVLLGCGNDEGHDLEVSARADPVEELRRVNAQLQSERNDLASQHGELLAEKRATEAAKRARAEEVARTFVP